MWIKPILLGLLAALCLFVVTLLAKAPRHDRIWMDDVSRLAKVDRAGDGFSIADYRNWTHATDGPTGKTWRDFGPVSITDLRRVWFVLEPHPGLAGQMAHTMALFEFESGELIGLSVEARKELGEPYSVVAGAFNGFELTYVWATPQDLLTRRVLTQNHEVYLYELALTQAEAEAYLGALLDKTASIAARPRFYNTLLSNCTNELAKTAGLAWHPAFVLTGTSDKALFKMDRIRGQGSFAEIKAAARADLIVREIADLDEHAFNAALLEAMIAAN